MKPTIISFLNLSSFSHHTDCVVPVGEPLFKPTPPLVAFVDFEGLQTYDATLSLRNQDNVARRVKVTPPDSSYFEVLPGRGRKKSTAGDKVAPGMEISYTIRFKPEVRVNYCYDLLVVTEREEFTIPIRATGGSALLEFPDLVDFGAAPVKHESAKTVLVRNIGDRPTKFLLKTPPPFGTSVLDGYLEVGASMQVDILFKPDRAKHFEGELILVYGDSVEAYVELRGRAENVEVCFSQESLTMSDTFIALSTQSTIVLRNLSDVPVDFSWRAFPVLEEEINQKLKLQVQLKKEESEECQALMQLQEDEEYTTDEESTDSSTVLSEDSRPADVVPRENRLLGKLQQKYRNIAKAIMEDPMFFYDEIFAVEPLSGRIWAKSQTTITVTFTPKAALTYQCFAYCSVVGQAERMPLLLKGQGIGPKAAFSYDELDVGDVFVESVHQYQVDLINQGDIAVNFQLTSNSSPFGSRFNFTPSHSRLEVGSSVSITVEFCPDLLGEFHETFYWDLVGSASSIPLTFRGHSVAPTFHFDVDRISFGVVSYGFLNSKALTLSNTSEVPMRFALRIPGDGRFLQKEFDVIPPRGMLLPSCSQKVQIDFISVNVKTYDLCLVVDLEGVGQELASIPIQARCAVPTVSFEPHDMLEYGDVFLRYPAHQALVLHNTSALPAKFQILPQDEQTKMLAEYEPDQVQGSVPAASSHVVTLTLTSKKIGQLQIPLSCRILGHNVPHPLMLTANSIGPIVNVDPVILDWGNIKCLERITRTVKLTNDSVIDASVRAFMKSKASLWTVEPKSIQLKPHETVPLSLTLAIDETIKMSDVMHLVVTDGKDATVTVRAKGIDTPVTCSEALDIIDFGIQYTTRTIMREVLIENRGRQPRKLVWVPEAGVKKKRPSHGRNSTPDSDHTKKRGAEVVEEEEPPVFSVIPDTLTLEGKTAYRFQFSAVCSHPGPMSEIFLCQEFVAAERKGRTVFRSELRGEFVAPLLDLSANTLPFKFMWDKLTPIAPMSQQLSISNVSLLDVSFFLKVQPPFSVNTESLSLRPQERAEVLVEFDPGFKVDRLCGVVRQKLTLIYEDHPQKDYVNLVGELVFPNIVLSTDSLDFGSVLNETTKELTVTISNPNPLPVNYEWILCEEEEMSPELELQEPSLDSSLSLGGTSPPTQSAGNTQTSGFGVKTTDIPEPLGVQTLGFTSTVGGALMALGGTTGLATMQLQQEGVDISRIFDILPIMGRLEPGESQKATFTYFGLKNQKFEATAVCRVEGGPEYEVFLKGQASRLEFRIDRMELDFGEVLFNQVLEKEISLVNTGKVAYYYNFNLSGISRPFVVDASPLSGLINAEEKQKVVIRFRAGIPDEVCEVALVEVAHFEPHRLTVKGRGTFPGILLSPTVPQSTKEQLHRRDEEDHRQRRDAACKRLMLPLPGEPSDATEVSRRGSCGATSVERRRRVAEEGSSARGAGASSPGPDEPEQQAEQPQEPLHPPPQQQENPQQPPEEVGRQPVEQVQPEQRERQVNPPPEALDTAGSFPPLGAPDDTALIEFEVDRNFLCEMLLEKERAQLERRQLASGGNGPDAAATEKSLGSPLLPVPSTPSARQIKELPPITAAYYVCDFGHIVLGHSGKVALSITNCYREPISFTINRRMLQQFGYTVLPERARNLPAGKSVKLELTSFRPKDTDEGREEVNWVIPIKDGPSYEVKLISDFVLPDLKLSQEVIDFGRVLIGQRKRITVRLKNVKAVPVEWEYKPQKGKYGKPLPPTEVVFALSPSSGKLRPGESAWATVSFTPNATKLFAQKLALRINDNPNKKLVSLYGQGEALRVEVQPSSAFRLGPILPKESCSQEFFLHNPTDYPIEVYSVDFDADYLAEEAALREFDKYDTWNLAELPVRAPGQRTWSEVQDVADQARQARQREERARQREEKARQREEAVTRGEDVPPSESEDGGTKDGEEASHATAEEVAEVVAPDLDVDRYPYRVPDQDRLNVLLIGPPLCGKSSVAQALLHRHRRRVVTVDRLLEDFLASPASLQSAEDQTVRARLREITTQWEEKHDREEADREEECRKKKHQYVRRDPPPYPLAVEDVVYAIRRRTTLPDCNCGITCDNLGGRFLGREKEAEVLFSALRAEKFLVLCPALGGHLGFSPREPAPLGLASALLEGLSANGEGEEQVQARLQEFTAWLQKFYGELKDFLQTRRDALQVDLQEAKDRVAALPAVEAADEASADGGVGTEPHSATPTSPTPGQQPQLLSPQHQPQQQASPQPSPRQANRRGSAMAPQQEVEQLPRADEEKHHHVLSSEREELNSHVEALQQQLDTAVQSLAHLPDPGNESRMGEIISELKAMLSMLEAAATEAKTGEAEGHAEAMQQTQLNRRRSTRRRTQAGASQTQLPFAPPQRSDEAMPVMPQLSETGVATTDATDAVTAASTAAGAAPLVDAVPSASTRWTLIPLVGASPLRAKSAPFSSLLADAEAVVPAPLVPDEKPLPPPSFAQLVSCPPQRPPHATPAHFALITPSEGATEDAASAPANAAPTPAPAAHSVAPTPAPGGVRQSAMAGGAAAKAQAAEAAAAAAAAALQNAQTRWIIAPGQQQKILLNFSANDIGTFITPLRFEVVGSGIHGNAPVMITASGVTAHPAINSDPRNVFMRRVRSKPASGYASKQYVTSLSTFDFGPLLAGREKEARKAAAAAEAEALDPFVRQHIEAFRITNNSLFKATVKFGFASTQENGKEDFDEYPFLVEPKQLDLEIDETQEIKVCCFPTREGVYSDKLVASVQHNPKPLEFPLSAIGSLPKINVETTEVDFDRLLLKQQATNFIRFSNVCAVPVRWCLRPPKDKAVPEPFLVEQMEGTLAVGDECSIGITFKAERAESHSFTLSLQVSDNENLRPLEEVKVIELKAEAFAVDVVPEFPNGGRGLDYGDIQVGVPTDQFFHIKNNGKYPVTYEVKIRRRVIREILEVEAKTNEAGVALLEPGEKQQVRVRCRPQQEMQCPDPNRRGRNEELELLVFESRSGENVSLDLPPIPLTFRALFSSFVVTPPQGLNFGPIRMGESSSRNLEIHNDGIFKFEWWLFDPARLSESSVLETKPDGNELLVGPFKVTPATGALNPKDTAKVEVKFSAAATDGDFDCRFAFSVSGTPEFSAAKMRAEGTEAKPSKQLADSAARNEATFREWQLVSHSCTPGIETSNLATVFEEQFVARTLEDAIATAGRVDIHAFCEEDRIFSFGPVVLQSAAAAGEAPTNDTAKLRITNPKAIPCDVKLDLKTRGQIGKEPPPFELSAHELHLPPRESRYVKVRFKPSSQQTYSATFEASVPDGKDPLTNSLKFELRGDGTLPTVSLETSAHEPPSQQYQFGKLRVGRSHTLGFILRNGGVIAASAKCEVKASPHFTVTCPKTLTLGPKETQPFQVRFHPSEAGDSQAVVQIGTIGNASEDTTLKFSGKGYVDEIFWDLQERNARTEMTPVATVMPPAPDELFLGEVAVGSEASTTLCICNGGKEPIRFQFPEALPVNLASSVSMSPSVGHVAAGARKPITVTFRPGNRIDPKVDVLNVATAAIAYEGEPEDWDDSMRTIVYPEPETTGTDPSAGGAAPAPPASAGSAATAQSAAPASAPDAAAQGMPVEQVAPEPPHRLLDGTSRDLQLKVSGQADDRSYECTTDRIYFHATVMFQARVHRFTMKNPSRIVMPYDWRIIGMDGVSHAAGQRAYSISPQRGSIPAGATEEFTVRFAPTEVSSFACRLDCRIPGLPATAKPLQVMLDALATRPWCHFEIPASDYLSRRQNEIPLDPKYRIVEFESLGTRVKNLRRFYVLNPTAETYEFTWSQEKIGEPDDSFRCLTRRGSILSGKKYEMVFEYMPMTTGTHESFWTFAIADKQARQSFMVVGSVKEPRVGVDRPSINFNRLLLGTIAKDTVNLVNKEHIPLNFSFDTSSFEAGEDQVTVLEVSPLTGVIGPGTTCAVEVTFTPADEKAYNFNLLCAVKRKLEPVFINVKGEGYKARRPAIVPRTDTPEAT